MINIKCIALSFAALAITACGGDSESAGAAANSAENAIKYEMYTADVHKGEDAIKLYTSRMNQIAEALEQIEDKLDAEHAARMIAETAQEYEQLEARLDELGRTDMARSMAESGYGEMYMRRYNEAQTRFTAAIQKVAEENPRFMLKLGKALQKVQGQAL